MGHVTDADLHDYIRMAEEYAVEAFWAYGPREAPLSGEWASEPTPQDVLEYIGFEWRGDEDDADADKILSAYEDHYAALTAEVEDEED